MPMPESLKITWVGFAAELLREYDTIRDAILTCAQKSDISQFNFPHEKKDFKPGMKECRGDGWWEWRVGGTYGGSATETESEAPRSLPDDADCVFRISGRGKLRILLVNRVLKTNSFRECALKIALTGSIFQPQMHIASTCATTRNIQM